MIYSFRSLFSVLFYLSLGWIAVRAANDPTEIRLAYGSPQGYDSMAVSFTVDKLFSSTPTISYGNSINDLNQSSNDCENHTYGTKIFYDCLINGLKPNMIYYYQINADSAGPSAASSIYSFRSGKAAADKDPSLRLIVIGDMGLKNSDDTLASMIKLVSAGAGNNTSGPEIDMVLHIGDISYADDFYLRWGDDYEGSWEKWQKEMTPITSITPYMTLPGNHEVTCSEATPFLCPEGQKNFTAYRHRFRMPWEESGGSENLWYSFNAGLVHFIQINTETDFPGSPEGPGTYLGGGGFGNQTEWLLNDLIEATKPENRALRPWIIVSGHRPFYSSTTGKQCAGCQTSFESLFNQYGVDIYFSGHVHWYERLYAIVNGKVTNQDYSSLSPQDGPVYIVNGAAGNVEGHSTGSKGPLAAFVDDSHYGYGILEVVSSSTINWAFYNAADQSLIDKVTIVRKH